MADKKANQNKQTKAAAAAAAAAAAPSIAVGAASASALGATPERPRTADRPAKKVKQEPVADSPTPARSAAWAPGVAAVAMQASAKRPRDVAASPAAPGAAPALQASASHSDLAVPPAAGGSPRQKKQQRIARNRGGDPMAQALSIVRKELEQIEDVDGVREQLDRLPECVLVGSIPARRELMASLLGGEGHAANVAASLVAPGMRQPLMLELRCGADGIDLTSSRANEWYAQLVQSMGPALGKNLKVDPMRIMINATDCTNLDVLELPERVCFPGQQTNQKIEDMRQRHLASAVNILVCLERGQAEELCRHFDPARSRTVLVGAATAAEYGEGAEGETLPASTLCGPAAARLLEERFAAMCRERAPQWLQGLEKLEARLTKSQGEAREHERGENPWEVLARARQVAESFCRTLQQVVRGTISAGSTAFTLEEELRDFAGAAAQGECGAGVTLSAQDASAAAADLFGDFGGVDKYAEYLLNKACITGADQPLNGGAAWHRLLAEVDVAMRLARPPQEKLEQLCFAAIRCGGTGVHGHQRWEDVSAKLMFEITYEPLRRRLRYIAARMVRMLKRQKGTVTEQMAEDSGSKLFGNKLIAKHIEILRNSAIVRDGVLFAYDKAASTVAEKVLKNLQGTLTAGCINPNIMLRPKTTPKIDCSERTLPKTTPEKTRKDRFADTQKRVTDEMARREAQRSEPSKGLPLQLRDKTFEPCEVTNAMPYVEQELRRAFSVLAKLLATQATAFAETALKELCEHHVVEAMSNIDFTPEQHRALKARHNELQDTAGQVELRLDALRRCLAAVRGCGVRGR